jgi:hypothetical protein
MVEDKTSPFRNTKGLEKAMNSKTQSPELVKGKTPNISMPSRPTKGD